MTDRPILFSAPMVRALLDGRKTQTRRIMKQQPKHFSSSIHPTHVAKHAAPYLDSYCSEKKTATNPRGMSRDWRWWTQDDRCGPAVGNAPCVPGDRLWARETFLGWWNTSDNTLSHIAAFKADGYELEPGERWIPSIHMPRRLSRLTLTVTGVRAERLQDISEDDARAEGAFFTDFGTFQPTGSMSVDGGNTFHPFKPQQNNGWHMDNVNGPEHCLACPSSAFANYWVSLNGPKSWNANPWVWVIEFDVVRGNIDEVSV